MSDNVVGIIGGTVGIGRYIVNDYVITLTQAEGVGEGEYGYTMTITRGTETQTVTLYGLTAAQYDQMVSNLQLAQAAAQEAQSAATAASRSATHAASDASSAYGFANDAKSARAQAQTSASNASTYKSQAQAAATDAETAQTAAETAATNAQTAKADAQTAAAAAAAAQSAAETAETHASDSASQASTSAQSAADSASEAERVLDSIPADYSEMSADVADLKSQSPSIATPEETEADLYICDSNGNVIAKFVDGNIVTKNFDSGAIQLDLIMEADSNAADLYIADSFGNVVAEFKDGNIITKNFNSGDYDEALSDIAALQTDVEALQAATSGILYRTHDQTDGVYAACRYHQPTLTSKQFCILIAGDVHADTTRMQGMIDYLNALDAFDAGIMLGDMSGNTFDSPITYYTDAISNANKPFLTVIGNHDVGGATSESALWTKYGPCFEYADLASGEAVEGKCYYYKDFAAQKIRVIVLMQYDFAGRSTDDSNLCFGQAQIDWLISTLNSTPSDYGVIIAEHTNPSRYMTYNMDEAYTSSTWARTNYAPAVMDGDPVPDIVNAWINGGTLSQTYNYTFENPPTPLSVSADFTARGAGEFISYLGGHWHMDVLGAPTSYSDQPDYHVPAAGLSAATQGDIPRRSGTVSEDSMCAIAVDRDKQIVKVFHVGAHYTKDAIDRQYFKYSYGGNNA